MKQEERLNLLFKAAREEEVKFSYEQLVNQFKLKIVSPKIFQQSLSKITHLNTLLIVFLASFIGIWWYLSPTPSSKIIDSSIDTITTTEFSNLTVKMEEARVTASSTSPFPVVTPKQIAISSKQVDSSTLIQPLPSVFDTTKNINLPPISSLEQQRIKKVAPHRNKSIPTIFKSPTISHHFLKITHQDDAKQVLKTKQALTDIGFEVKKLHTNRKQKEIQSILFHLRHPDGLDWKFRVKDFEQIELKIIKDNRLGLRAFAYRFGQQTEFSPLIYLNEKSISKHRVASGTKGRHITRRKKPD
ncbi:MAG: hypothetical protein AAGG68_03460 [Bacteroidota bacterium]